MYCQNCGNELPEGAKFCPNCGTKIAAVAPVPKKPAEDVPFHINNIIKEKEEQPAPPRRVQKKETKKENGTDGKRRLGCTATIFALLAIALIAGGILFVYTHFAKPKNALLPEEIAADTVAVEDEDDFFNDEEEINLTAEEAALRRRVQNIYRDVFQFRNGANYEGRYCTSNLYRLLHRAQEVAEAWPEASWWTFTQDWHFPTIDYIKVVQSSPTSATVRLTIRPIRNSQIVNEVTLKMVNEDGAWLIDDFQCQGQSVKYSARQLIEEHEIRTEIMRELQDTAQ